MNRRAYVIGISLLGAFALTSCGSGGGLLKETPPTYKYRLSATVDTPQGERQGHSVIAVWWRGANPVFGTQGSAGFTVKGEAVAVDLPDNQTLFVLLTRPGDQDWAAYNHESVKLAEPEDSSRAAYMAKIAADRGVHPLNRRRKVATEDSDNYPYFVRFKDINDPKSVEQVDPDNLAKSFGTGVKLKSLTVQMTDEPVTVGIEKRLGWLGTKDWKFADDARDPKTGYLVPPINPTIANYLNDGDFWRKP